MTRIRVAIADDVEARVRGEHVGERATDAGVVVGDRHADPRHATPLATSPPIVAVPGFGGSPRGYYPSSTLALGVVRRTGDAEGPAEEVVR